MQSPNGARTGKRQSRPAEETQPAARTPINPPGTPPRYIAGAFGLLLLLAVVFIAISCWLLWYPR